MDLALAHLVRQKLEAAGTQLDRWQAASLVHACRVAKEQLLVDPTLAAAPIAIASRGSALLGSTLRTELTREEVTQTLVEGFFPEVPRDARPVTRARAGLTQLGLPYASDPAVTRHLAWFLARQAGALAKLEGFAAPRGGKNARAPALLHPTAVLFNGGVMKAAALRDRIVGALEAWLESDGAPAPRVLEGADLDLAVARGACAYGLARRGRGLRIRGGTARAYYVGFESAVPAVPGVEPPVTAMCVAPFGMEEGTEAKLPAHELGVVVGESVRFRFFGSSVRREDAAGAVLEDWKRDGLEELAPIEVTLAGRGAPRRGRRAGPPAVPGHGGGHAAARGRAAAAPQARREMAGRAQRQGRRLGCHGGALRGRHRPRDDQHRRCLRPARERRPCSPSTCRSSSGPARSRPGPLPLGALRASRGRARRGRVRRCALGAGRLRAPARRRGRGAPRRVEQELARTPVGRPVGCHLAVGW